MALYEYFCESCKTKFEQIRSASDQSDVQCAKCDSKQVKRLISRFAVAGQGDLRESTMHGCHDCQLSTPLDKHRHSGGCCGGGGGAGAGE